MVQSSCRLSWLYRLCILIISCGSHLISFARVLNDESVGGEKVFFTRRQMSPGVSYRQDVCDRNNLVQNGTVELKDALRGLQLNVLMAAYEGAYFNYDNETGIDAYPGVAGVILDELALRAGFTWRNSFGIYVTPAGEEYNETWTDLLGWSVETYDLTVDWWARSLDRMNMGVAFLREWYDSSIILIGNNDFEIEDDGVIQFSDFWNWLKPFDQEVWMTTVATIVVSGLVYQILEWVAGEHGERTLWEWFSDNMLLSFLNATQAYEYGTPKSLPTKIFSFSMALWALILTATYTANLASLLVDRGPSIRDIDAVDKAAVEGFPICTWEGTILDVHIEQNYHSAIRKPKKTVQEVYDGLNSGECAFAVEAVQGWKEFRNKRALNPRCSLEWVGDDRKISSNGAGFVAKADAGFKCTGLVRDVIDVYMEELITEEFIDKAWDFENKRKQDIDCDTFRTDPLEGLNAEDSARRLQMRKVRDAAPNSDARNRRKLKASTKAASSAGAIDGNESEQMKLEAMIGSFFIHWMLMGISIAIAIANRFWKGRQMRLKSRQKLARKRSAMSETDVIVGDVSSDHVRGEKPSAAFLEKQIEFLNNSLNKSQVSQTRMMEEQQELRDQIESLSGMLQTFLKMEKKEVHVQGTF